MFLLKWEEDITTITNTKNITTTINAKNIIENIVKFAIPVVINLAAPEIVVLVHHPIIAVPAFIVDIQIVVHHRRAALAVVAVALAAVPVAAVRAHPAVAPRQVPLVAVMC